MVDIDIVLITMMFYSGALFLRELGSRDTGQNSITAFCFNAGRTMPPEITVLDAGFDSVIVNTKYDRESNVSSFYMSIQIVLPLIKRRI